MSMDKDGDSPISPHELEADEEGQINQNEADTIENSGEVNNKTSTISNKSNIINSIQTEFASHHKECYYYKIKLHHYKKKIKN